MDSMPFLRVTVSGEAEGMMMGERAAGGWRSVINTQRGGRNEQVSEIGPLGGLDDRRELLEGEEGEKCGERERERTSSALREGQIRSLDEMRFNSDTHEAARLPHNISTLLRRPLGPCTPSASALPLLSLQCTAVWSQCDLYTPGDMPQLSL